MSMLLFLALSAAIGIFSVLTGSVGAFQGKVLLTTISLGVYSLTGLCCSTILDRPNLSTFAALGIGASILGGAFAAMTNWEILTGWEIVLKGRLSLLIIAISAAHISLLMRIKVIHTSVRIARGCTIGSIAIVALLLLGIIAAPESVLASCQVVAVFGILDVLGTIGTPILQATVRSPSGC